MKRGSAIGYVRSCCIHGIQLIQLAYNAASHRSRPEGDDGQGGNRQGVTIIRQLNANPSCIFLHVCYYIKAFAIRHRSTPTVHAFSTFVVKSRRYDFAGSLPFVV